MRGNLDGEKKEHFQKKDNKRKKEKRDNLGDNEIELLRKYKKEGKKVMCNNLDDKKDHLKKKDNKRKKEKCDSLKDDEKEQIRKNDKERKMDKHLQILDERSNIFNDV